VLREPYAWPGTSVQGPHDNRTYCSGRLAQDGFVGHDRPTTWLRARRALWIVLGFWIVLQVALLLVPRDWVDVARTSKVDPIVYVPDHTLFVIRSGRGFLALSAISPHRPEIGKRLLYCPAGYFVGPHGELFDRRGLYVDGPSPRGMDRFKVRVAEGTIEVRVGDPIDGPPRDVPGLFPARSIPCPMEDWVETRPGFIADLHQGPRS
jgi:hypothetical protein